MRLLLTIILFFYWSFSFGQPGFVTKYYTKDDEEIFSKKDSYYYEIQKENLIDNDTIIAFFSSNDQLKSLSVVNRFGYKNGIFMNYYENGKLKAKGQMKNGGPIGTLMSYYSNGATQSIESFDESKWELKLVDYFDTLGNQLIKNGNGYCRCFFEAYSNNALLEEGKLIGGKKDSNWNGYRNGKKYFEEVYDNGKLVNGLSYDSLGNSYKYQEISVTAAPSNGLQGLYSAITKKIRYPADARRSGIEGKVFVQFIVNKDGSVSDFKPIKGIGYGCDEEAVRAVKEAALNWIPGKERGQIVRQRMVLPIIFKLG